MQVLEQKTYSVTMTEEELRLFSEFLEERGFANKRQMKKVAKAALDASLGRKGSESAERTLRRKLGGGTLSHNSTRPIFAGKKETRQVMNSVLKELPSDLRQTVYENSIEEGRNVATKLRKAKGDLKKLF